MTAVISFTHRFKTTHSSVINFGGGKTVSVAETRCRAQGGKGKCERVVTITGFPPEVSANIKFMADNLISLPSRSTLEKIVELALSEVGEA